MATLTLRNSLPFWQSTTVIVGLILLANTCQAQIVYEHDFHRPDRLREYWSHIHRGSPEKGNRIFLGPFADENVALTLDKLPKHKYLKIDFTLFVMIGWGGSRTDGFAPDLWQLAVKDGPLLVNTSFSLWPKLAEHPQAFPDVHSAGLCKAGTGAAEQNTLGFIYDTKWGVRDSVYRISEIFPHDKDTVQFNFAHVGRTGRRYRPVKQPGQWGLDNIRVEALQERSVNKLTPGQLEQTWKDLTTTDAVQGSKAVRLLLGAGQQSIDFLRSKIGKKATAAQIDAWISELNHDKFSIRTKAEQRLLYQAHRWMDRIEKAKQKPKSLEQRQRIERILATVRGSNGNRSFFRRWVRLQHVLQFSENKE